MIKQIIQRVKSDFNEYVQHQKTLRQTRRDNRRIKRAIQLAKEKNAIDGKSYYILRSPSGFPGAYNSNDIKYLRRVGIIPKEIKYEKLLESALAVVTSNQVKIAHYSQIQNQKEEME